jgi:AcrR family transcriptional regulator
VKGVGAVTLRVDDDVRARLVGAAMTLLAREGPGAVKARSVATDAGLTTAAVYSYFGGMSELMGAVSDRGFELLGAEFGRCAPTGDAGGDIYALALRCRSFAHANPHRYDLMFGLSGRGTYRAAARRTEFVSGRSAAFIEAYQHLIDACSRLVASGRLQHTAPEAAAARLWTMVHGFVSLELAHHFDEFGDPVAEVLEPMAVNLFVGMGDRESDVRASLMAGARR